MAAESTASTTWEGDLAHGHGTTSTASGTLDSVEVSWPARVERTEGTTSPEELLAAAHAACYCMGLSHELGEAGNPPERLQASVTISFVPGEGVRSSAITVSGSVAGIDQAKFGAAAEAAAQGCPISGAMAGNVEITVEGRRSTTERTSRFESATGRDRPRTRAAPRSPWGVRGPWRPVPGAAAEDEES